MAKFNYENQVSIRSAGEVICELDQVVGKLRGAGRLRFQGRKITKEAVVNATLLWLAGQPIDDVERALGPYVARLEDILADGGRDGVEEPTVGL